MSGLPWQAKSNDGSVANKVARKLMEDPEAFCGCIRAIDVESIQCSGFGVVPAVQKIETTCDLLQDPEVQARIIAGAPAAKAKAQEYRDAERAQGGAGAAGEGKRRLAREWLCGL
jgi:hypothetical protein